MNRVECYNQLKNCLLKYVDNDYILLDLPYFSNVGDVLIWQSAKELLKEVPYRCLYSASIETYHKIEIPEPTVIIFMGGGNFGDLWIRHQIFRQRVLKDYPKNKVIQLPQSALWNDKTAMQEDVKIFSDHKAPIVLMAREINTCDLFKKVYPFTEITLVPDLVLSFNAELYCKKHHIELVKGKNTLLVQRCDIEKNTQQSKLILAEFSEISDWPCMRISLIEDKIYHLIMKIARNSLSSNTTAKIQDFFYQKVLIHAYIKSGIKYLNRFETVYSTRLHAAVLAWLIGKRTFIIDNSYGKCKGVYDNWLCDQDKIIML